MSWPRPACWSRRRSLPARPLPAVVQVVSYQPEQIELDVGLDAPGALVLADTWYPGWQATVDGEPAALLRADYLFRAVLLPAGQHRVQFDYRPADAQPRRWHQPGGGAAAAW